MKIKMTEDRRLSIATAKGPSAALFKNGKTYEVSEVLGRIYLANGSAVAVGKPAKQEAPAKDEEAAE